MTINGVYTKLRKHNIKNYYLLFFSLIVSMALITSYAAMYLSPTVMNVLPEGGDSRKQAIMIFGIAIIGCGIFTTYAGMLFFRYKSRETGILMALGSTKKQITRVLARELVSIILVGSIVGVTIGIPLSFIIWKMFEIFIIDSPEMTYIFGVEGLFYSIIFFIFLSLVFFVMVRRFIKRTNIIDIINSHRKSEPIKEVKGWYGLVGIILIIVGFVGGYAIPSISIVYFKFNLPVIIRGAIYILGVVGVYMLMIYIVVHGHKGKNPEKYYKHIISRNMMKFQGRQTVLNMCITALLIIGALFAAFIPGAIGISYAYTNNPYDFQFTYKMTENQIQKEEIEKLSKEYNVPIKDYTEIISIWLIRDGYNQEWLDNGQIIETYYETYSSQKFISESDFNRIEEAQVEIPKGYYMRAVSDLKAYSSELESIKVTNPVTGDTKVLEALGNKESKKVGGISDNKYDSWLVLDDEDYKEQAKYLEDKHKARTVVFNVEDYKISGLFAEELKSQIVYRSSQDVAIYPWYDEYQAEQLGEEYPYSKGAIELDPYNPELMRYWKYMPVFRMLGIKDFVLSTGVLVMLFSFITIICFATVGIMSYTRSITIAMNNKQVYENLKRLGASREYINKCILKQLIKVFVIPVSIGSIIMYLLYVAIMVGNGPTMYIEPGEAVVLIVNLLVVVLAYIYMYIIYRCSRRKTLEIIWGK